jgi:hypothetical protein
MGFRSEASGEAIPPVPESHLAKKGEGGREARRASQAGMSSRCAVTINFEASLCGMSDL